MTAPLLEVDDLHITLEGDGKSFNAVENVPLNSVCVAWQCTQAYPSRPRLVRIGST